MLNLAYRKRIEYILRLLKYIKKNVKLQTTITDNNYETTLYFEIELIIRSNNPILNSLKFQLNYIFFYLL